MGTAALFIYDKRSTDLPERDHVHLLWIIVEGDLLRAEVGVIWYYEVACGYWRQFHGLLPKHIFAHISDYLHTLEGLFRSFTGTVARDHTALLHAMDDVMNGKTPDDIILDARWNTMCSRGNALLEKRGSGPPPSRWRAPTDFEALPRDTDDWAADHESRPVDDLIGAVPATPEQAENALFSSGRQQDADGETPETAAWATPPTRWAAAGGSASAVGGCADPM